MEACAWAIAGAPLAQVVCPRAVASDSLAGMHAGDAVVDSGSPRMSGFVGYAGEKTLKR